MSRFSRFLALLVVVMALSVQASTAFAATSGWNSVDVNVQSEEQQQAMLLVSGQLADGAKLPAEAELAVPAGTQFQWIGEILGGDPSKDPALKYSKASSNGMDVYRFVLTKSRVAQLEVSAPGTVTFDGKNSATALKWTAWQDIREVNVSQLIPQGSQIVQAAPGASVEPGPTGFSLYTKTISPAKAGDVLDLAFSYAPPAAASTTGNSAGSSNSSAIVPVILALVAIGAFGLLFMNVRKKMAGKTDVDSPRAGKSVSASRATTAGTTSATKKSSRPEPAVETAPKRLKLLVPTLVVIGVLVLGATIAGTKGASSPIVGGKITKNFGAASACQSGSVSITANDGVDLEKQGGKLLKAFQGMKGVGDVTIDLVASKVDMAWCESEQSEATMREALSGTGLVTIGESVSAGASTSATATVAATRKTQTANVDTSSGSFAPSRIVLKAGVPAEITFGGAAGCLSEVVIGDLNVNQDLTKGPATVKLPALDPGTHDFACEMGHQSGQIVVQ